MKLLAAILPFLILVASLPSPDRGSFDGVEGIKLPRATVNCQPGFVYCFAQIVQDLGKLTFLQ